MTDQYDPFVVTAMYGDKIITVEVIGYDAASEYANTLVAESKNGGSYGKVFIAVYGQKGKVWSYEVYKEMKQ